MFVPLLLVTGAQGQVGREVCAQAPGFGWRVAALGHGALDITRGPEVTACLARLRPGLVINAAAYTAVDRAESEPEHAFAVNGTAPGHLAQGCAGLGIPLFHLSTDYVFDGPSARPWRETDPVHPLGVYGRSKWAGEEAVRQRLERHLILRTAWVFSPHGHNFVKTMLRLGRERDELAVVADQTGSPTAAADVAHALLTLATRLDRGGLWGTYHYAGFPPATWHGLAEAVFRHGVPALLPRAPRVRPIPSAEYPTPARRPLFSVLDCTAIRERQGISAPAWEPALVRVLAALAGAVGE